MMLTFYREGRTDKELILPLEDVSNIVGKVITKIAISPKNFSLRWWLHNVFNSNTFIKYHHRYKDSNLALQTYILESSCLIGRELCNHMNKEDKQ